MVENKNLVSGRGGIESSAGSSVNQFQLKACGTVNMLSALWQCLKL